MTALEKQARVYDENFGKYIRDARNEKFPNLSGRKFAKDIGITGAYLSNIEYGKVPPPSVKIVIALAEKLELDKHKLINMAGHLDPSLIPILKDIPTGFIQALKIIEKSLGEEFNGATFAHIIGLFLSRLQEMDLEDLEKEPTIGYFLRTLADVFDTIEENQLSSVEVSKLVDKGLSFLSEIIPETNTIGDAEDNDSD